MSSLMMQKIWDCYPAGGKELAVALALADKASEDGHVVLDDVAKIMQKARVESNTCYWGIAAMHRRGWLRVVSLPDHSYRIAFPS